MTVTVEGASQPPFYPNGVATAFPFDQFTVSDAADVRVKWNGSLVDPALYRVALNGDGTGTVTFLFALAGGELIVYPEPSFSQPATLQNQGPYFQKTLEGMIDHEARKSLYLRGLAERTFLSPMGEQGGTIPSATARAGRFFSFDADGNPFAASGTGADGGLRQDLAGELGAALIKYGERTLANYLEDVGSSVVYVRGGGGAEDATAELQAAVNKWNEVPDLTIEIAGRVQIAGTITVPNLETLNPERRLTIRGGTLAKSTAGKMFTRPDGQGIGDLQLQTGHVTFDNVRFVGPRSAGTFIIDGDNLIRVKLVNCFADGIQLAHADGYLQSIYVDSATVFRKWGGWLIDCGYLYDVKFYGTAEAGDGFLRTRDAAADPAANSLVVRGNIEGLAGKVFEVGVCFGVVIDGNYHEGNASGDYDFSVGLGFHKGLTLIGNGFQPKPEQMANPNYYPVKLGKGAQNSITLIGNASTHNLFDVASGNQSAIVDMGNWCAGKKFSDTSTRRWEFDGIEMRGRLLPGLGLVLNSSRGLFGFEQYRETVGAASLAPGIVMGPRNPQSFPGDYPETGWVKGTIALNSAPAIAPRQFGELVLDALIFGWVCTASGPTGAWQEIAFPVPQ